MMKKRRITHGKVKFPSMWIELNPECAKHSENVVICTDGSHVGIYYTENSAEHLSPEELIRIDTYADIFDFSKNYSIYGLVEQTIISHTSISNVDNAQLIRN